MDKQTQRKIGSAEIKALADRITGVVNGPQDEGYAKEFAGFNLTITKSHSPDVVVGVKSAEDVAESVRFAKKHGLKVTIQSTGHGGYSRATSGVLICTHRMNNVTVDPDTRIATLSAGVRWKDLIPKAAEYGLAPIVGSSEDVGAIGFLLGGGIGPLVRSHGLASDYIQSFTVVTANGDIVEANATQNPELYWALRGGKGGLGVVAEIKLKLVEMKTIYGGALMFETKDIADAFKGWLKWTRDADPLVTSSVAVVNFPPFEDVPPPLRGRRLLTLRFAYPGSAEEGARLAAPLRAIAPVFMDHLGEMPASQIHNIHMDPRDPMPSWNRGCLLNTADDDVSSKILQHVGAEGTAPFAVSELRHYGSPRVAADSEAGSAASGRNANYVVNFIGVVHPGQSVESLDKAFAPIKEELQPWLSKENNINFFGIAKDADHFSSVWAPETATRLSKVRQQYDPNATFGFC
eukprot:TRINITY_DN5059_c0_g1_i1.p1 TRINITY_DN5059_c0_g1~~TRINITY_DN5059_c0_g1_i1.p1  ORF type:complete len:480 (+),score=92.65 TRINITY_DN5059_c0_g1_i1:53-1441(+)